MKFWRLIVLALVLLPLAETRAANPFLSAPDGKPVSAKFRGAEWGDNIAQEEIGLSARVVTTRVARVRELTRRILYQTE